tara:strand:+ start:995 stop:2185 length:1191 start_codon:yes stop_codon:yes gene_type:complete
MSKITYTLDDTYIIANFKVNDNIEDNKSSNKFKIKTPSINIDPKLRLAALNSISDGSSYFKSKLNEIEKSIDSNRINLNTINDSEIEKLKTYLLQNLESEIKSADKDCDYIINLINLFIKKSWNQLLDKTLIYTFNYCSQTGFENNIPFLLDIYKLGHDFQNYSIKTKTFQYLQNNNIENFVNNSNSKLFTNFPELLTNIPNTSTHSRSINIDSINNYNDDLDSNCNDNSHNNHDNNNINRSNNSISNTPNNSIFQDSPPLSQNHMQLSQKLESIEITNYNSPFISSATSPLRYIRNSSGLVYLFGILEIGNISSMSDQNQSTLFKLPPDCCPKYKINLFLNEDSESFSSFGRNGPSVANIVVNPDGRLIYKSNDVLNWSNKKIKLFFDGTIITTL